MCMYVYIYIYIYVYIYIYIYTHNAAERHVLAVRGSRPLTASKKASAVGPRAYHSY